jgi:hypothetical protein
MSESRRQRRQLAKKLGYLGKEETLDQQRERYRRSQEMGKYLHLGHLERIKNLELESERKNTERIEGESISGLINSNENVSGSSFDFLGSNYLQNSDLPQGSDSDNFLDSKEKIA